MMLCCGKWDEFGRYVGCGEPSSLLAEYEWYGKQTRANSFIVNTMFRLVGRDYSVPCAFKGFKSWKQRRKKKMLLLEFFLTKRTEKETMQFQKNALPISLKNLEL